MVSRTLGEVQYKYVHHSSRITEHVKHIIVDPVARTHVQVKRRNAHILSVDPIFQILWFLSCFLSYRVTANKEATKPRVPSG